MVGPTEAILYLDDQEVTRATPKFPAIGGHAGMTVLNGYGTVAHFRNFQMTGDVGKLDQ